MFRHGRRGWAVALALGAVAATTGLAGLQAGSASAQASYDAEPRDPQYIYDRTCGYCHGHNIAPIILGRKLPAATITYFVRNGQGAMPAFKPTEITDAELVALAQWIGTAEIDPEEHGQ